MFFIINKDAFGAKLTSPHYSVLKAQELNYSLNLDNSKATVLSIHRVCCSLNDSDVAVLSFITNSEIHYGRLCRVNESTYGYPGITVGRKLNFSVSCTCRICSNNVILDLCYLRRSCKATHYVVTVCAGLERKALGGIRTEYYGSGYVRIVSDSIVRVVSNSLLCSLYYSNAAVLSKVAVLIVLYADYLKRTNREVVL